MSEQAAVKLFAQLRRQLHPPVWRIADDQIEPFSTGDLFQAIANTHDRSQPHPRLAAQIGKRHVEAHARHPARERVQLEPAQTTLDALQDGRGSVVRPAVRHASRDRRQKSAPAAGRIENPRRSPVDPRVGGQVQQPFAQRGRRVVRPVNGPKTVGHHSGVEHAHRKGGIRRIHGSRGDADLLRQLSGLFLQRCDGHLGGQRAQPPRVAGHRPKLPPTGGHRPEDHCPREPEAVFALYRRSELPGVPRPFLDNFPRRGRRGCRGLSTIPRPVRASGLHDASCTCRGLRQRAKRMPQPFLKSSNFANKDRTYRIPREGGRHRHPSTGKMHSAV